MIGPKPPPTPDRLSLGKLCCFLGRCSSKRHFSKEWSIWSATWSFETMSAGPWGHSFRSLRIHVNVLWSAVSNIEGNKNIQSEWRTQKLQNWKVFKIVSRSRYRYIYSLEEESVHKHYRGNINLQIAMSSHNSFDIFDEQLCHSC